MKTLIKLLKTTIMLISVLLPVIGQAIHTIKPKIKEIWND